MDWRSETCFCAGCKGRTEESEASRAYEIFAADSVDVKEPEIEAGPIVAEDAPDAVVGIPDAPGASKDVPEVNMLGRVALDELRARLLPLRSSFGSEPPIREAGESPIPMAPGEAPLDEELGVPAPGPATGVAGTDALGSSRFSILSFFL